MEETIEEYKSSLEDLKFNSKPHINMLTMLAEENKQSAEYIVRIIEERIAKQAPVRLPILYLLDSIVKNVGENYKLLFAKKLNTTFKLAFEAANDKEKMSLYKLRSTWDDHFPLKKLHSLDLAIQALDPNWPVKPLSAQVQQSATKNIHVNPKFLKTNEIGSSSTPVTTKAAAKSVSKPTAIMPSNKSASEMDMIKQQLVKQRQQLLDLQQKKLLLELEETKSKLAAKQREVMKSQVPRDPRSHLPTSGVPGSLRVTLSNSKPAMPAAGQSSDAVKDPRLKSVNKKVSPEVPKATSKVTAAKKKKSPEKKEKNSPDIAQYKSKASKSSSTKQFQEKKIDVVVKKAKKEVLQENTVDARNLANEADHRKKRGHRSKPSASPSPPAKIVRRASPPRRAETLAPPASKPRREVPRDPRRQRADRNGRVEALKDQSKESSRSSEGSLSPRFSPEPDSDDVMSNRSPERMRFNRRNDALMRRPSFDPDLHIPQELTLGHQNEILRQANLQLNSGQLTHEQHQELLKQLHQLFEVQRIKKMQGTGGTPHRDAPPPMMRDRSEPSVDPRQLKKRNQTLKQAVEPERGRHPPPDRMERVPENYHHMRRPVPEKRRLPMEPVRKGGDPRHPRAKFPPNEHLFPPNQSLPPPKRQNKRQNVPHDARPPLPPPGSIMANDKPISHDAPFPRPPLRGPSRLPDKSPFLPPPFVHRVRGPRPNTEPHRGSPPRLSPPPFHPPIDENQGQGRNKMIVDVGKQKNLRKFAHGDARRNDNMRPEHRADARRKSRGSRDEPNKVLKPAIIENVGVSEKSSLEEPEDYIIANIPSNVEDTEDKLEEPEDFIIAEMKTAMQKRKDSCEEPEDFIIAEMPFNAESTSNQSPGVKRTTESEQAYLEHMKKIKQSMYTKEREANKRSNSSSNATTTEESSSEKSSAENEPPSKKDEVSKSPSLPLKKRRYISSEEMSKPEVKKTPEPVTENKDSSAEAPDKSKTEENKDTKEEKPLKPEISVKSEPETTHVIKEDNKPEPKPEKSKKETKSFKKESKPIKQKVQKGDPVPPSEEKPKTEAEKIKEINNDESSLIYVIDDESPDMRDTKKRKKENGDGSGANMRRRRPPPRSKDWHREEEEEEARLQMLMEDEKKQLEWEEMLQRELEREQWKEEDRMRRGQRGRPERGRGGRLPPPDHWDSPPLDMQEPPPFDIARGRLSRGRLHRPRPPRHDIGPPRRDRPFPPEEMRGHHPMDDMRRPPSPGEFRGHPNPGWERRRMSPPPRLHPREERPPEWDRPMGRPPPRDRMFRPEDSRPPVEEYPPSIREPPPVAPPINQVNVNKLLSDLVVMGIIPGSKKPGSKSSSPVPPQVPPEPTKLPSDPAPAPKVEATTSPVKVEKTDTRPASPFIEEDLMVLDPDARIPSVTLTSDLKERREEIVKRIYTGIQCSACGLRFTTRQTDLYADHLDWHYRANKKDKDGSALVHRELYPSAGDWITYEEIENPQDRGKNIFFDDKGDPDGGTANGDVDESTLTVPLTGKPGEDKCKVCGEAFETFYNEADDEWQFAQCVKVDGDNFHPNCYGDHIELTPLPVAMQTPLYNPLDGGGGIPGLDASPMKEEDAEVDGSDEEGKNEEPAQTKTEDPSNVDAVDPTTSLKEEVMDTSDAEPVDKIPTQGHPDGDESIAEVDASSAKEDVGEEKEENEEKSIETKTEDSSNMDAVDPTTSAKEEVMDTSDAEPVDKKISPDVILVDDDHPTTKAEDVTAERNDASAETSDVTSGNVDSA